ncbi:ABC transporter ATP-binding protein [Laribacter hongkongensis]|uniref:ABC transporter ATP-binding protein n=1 Tax=Laribacter hongkongensis TaxID=168471 RepID=UPI001EFDE762|nr:ATP-binding cassette domain-containing protein [Laribacter hongkongensis]MCG9081335.1 ATP-binding cassette domain-containing protein [Laribacter hongkongensis]
MACITLENVHLRYPLMGDTAKSLRARLASVVSGKQRGDTRPIYVDALQDLSLDLHDGDRIGLIGTNGAGKSSLLRMMAGIYQPTSGRLIREGNVLTMFDLSYGMDEEADGLENIEIAAAILGIPGKDLSHIKAEVSEFSELGDALLRPIRTYSAGMRVRLAFGLVSSLNADILLIDEIIGVGDSRFMKKASVRISKQVESAKIFVLASHAESVLRDFCTTGVVMSGGRIQFHGPINDALRFYNLSEG